MLKFLNVFIYHEELILIVQDETFFIVVLAPKNSSRKFWIMKPVSQCYDENNLLVPKKFNGYYMDDEAKEGTFVHVKIPSYVECVDTIIYSSKDFFTKTMQIKNIHVKKIAEIFLTGLNYQQ